MSANLFFILLLVSAIPGLVMPQSTTVEVQFVPVFPVVGGITEATCKYKTIALGQNVSSVTWIHNGTLPLTHGGRISINTDNGKGESVLEIDGVEERDAGKYTCRVDFQNPPQQTNDTASLQVASVLVVVADEEQTAIEGDNATLTCNVTSFPSPRIKWYRVVADNLTLLSDQNSDDAGFGVYVIPSVDRSNAGTYRCVGRYSFGSRDADIQLVVLTVPVITTPEAHLFLVTSDDLHLNCSATGVREPAYRWLFEGAEVGTGGRVEVGSRGELTVRNVSYDDTGSYICLAQTGAGTDNLTHTVTVSGPPEILLPGGELEVVVALKRLAELVCSFRSHPLPEVRWYKREEDGRREEINSLAGGFTIFPGNGSLVIANVSRNQASHYNCHLSNSFGDDNRTFFLRVIEPPNSPEEFGINEETSGGRSVGLEWIPPLSSDVQPLEGYLLQLTFTERDTVTSSITLPGNRTTYLAEDLVPGVSYTLVLRSSNFAGLSPPTSLSYTTDRTVPRLEFFTAESLRDGRSVLLQWRLKYSGGYDVDFFTIEVRVESEVVDTRSPDVYAESLVLNDLRPNTTYEFLATVGSSAGKSAPLQSITTTTIAAPSKPTTPQLEDRSVQTLTLSFSVKFGSASINYYLLRIYDTSDLTDTTNTTLTRVDREVNITAGDVEYVRGEEGRVEGGELVGYEVTVRVTGLSQGEEYVFSVAAASDVGVSDFSDLSDPFSLEDGALLYLLVFGVVAGVVVIAAVLVTVCCLGYWCRRSHRGGKMTITRRGSDSTGVATAYNLKFQPCNGSSYPDAASPTLSQSVDSVSPVPRVTSPHLPSDHYYNSLRKYQLDTLPVGAGSTEGVGGGGGGGGGRVVEVQVHSQTLNEQKQIDSGHYSRPTHHPSLPPSTHLTSHPPPFQPPPTLPSSSSSSSHQHPSYTLPTSHPLYSTPRKGNTAHRPQVSMSALPTSEERMVNPGIPGSSTLPHGADGYTLVQRTEKGVTLSEVGRNQSFISTSTPMINHSSTTDRAARPGVQTDV